jgi:hypothetical protein
LKYTQIFISFWLLFGTIQICYELKIFNDFETNLLYAISDLMVKFIGVIIIFDNESQKFEISNRMDLQSIQLYSQIFQTIENFKNENELSNNCLVTMNFLHRILKDIHPSSENNNLIKIELLKKILPCDFDDKYLMTNINRYRHIDNLCVLFTDIVSYSEYSTIHDEKKIYMLLNEMYIKFDISLRKYKNIQKRLIAVKS